MNMKGIPCAPADTKEEEDMASWKLEQDVEKKMQLNWAI